MEEVEKEIETLENEISEEGEQEEKKPETTEETVRRAYDELKAKYDKEETKQEERQVNTEVAQEVHGEEPNAQRPANEPAQGVEDVAPPQRWTAEGKEWFLKLPKEAKKEFAKAAKDYESHTTKLWQDLNREAKKYKEIDEVVTEYSSKWNLQGIAPAQAIRQLAAANDILLNSPLRGLDWLLKERGITPEQLIEFRKTGNAGQSTQNNNSFNDPQFQGLLSELNELKSWKAGLEENQTQALVSSIVQELDTVRNETDQSGRFKYPKLHDSDFLTRVKPLVSALKETHPSLSWADATRRAYAAVEGNTGSPSLQVPRLSRQATNTQQQRAKAVSVASRSRGSASSSSNDLSGIEVPRGVEDTVRLAMQLLSRD